MKKIIGYVNISSMGMEEAHVKKGRFPREIGIEVSDSGTVYLSLKTYRVKEDLDLPLHIALDGFVRKYYGKTWVSEIAEIHGISFVNEYIQRVFEIACSDGIWLEQHRNANGTHVSVIPQSDRRNINVMKYAFEEAYIEYIPESKPVKEEIRVAGIREKVGLATKVLSKTGLFSTEPGKNILRGYNSRLDAENSLDGCVRVCNDLFNELCFRFDKCSIGKRVIDLKLGEDIEDRILSLSEHCKSVRALLYEDLFRDFYITRGYKYDGGGKSILVDQEVVYGMPTGCSQGYIADRILNEKYNFIRDAIDTVSSCRDVQHLVPKDWLCVKRMCYQQGKRQLVVIVGVKKEYDVWLDIL